MAPSSRRRRALLCIAGAAFFSPQVLQAQSKEPKKVVWLYYGNEKARERIREGFRSRGIVEGRDISLTFQLLPANFEKEADELVDSLARSRPDAIVLAPHVAIWSLKRKITDIPVVFYNLGVDPVEFGLVESLGRPSGNFTGSTVRSNESFMPRTWQVFRQLVPSARRMGLLVDRPTSMEDFKRREPARFAAQRAKDRAMQSRLGIELVELRIDDGATREEIARIVEASGVHAVVLDRGMGGPIAQFAHTAPIPSTCGSFGDARKGCLIGWSFDDELGETYAVQAVYRILRGDSPAAIPVDQVNWEFAINRRRARELGIEIPAAMLIGAREIYD
jgi:putative ABC transport system substrate-binding protein